MKFGFTTKMMFSLIAVGVICTTVSIFVASSQLKASAESDLMEKSRQVLSQITIVGQYVSQMNVLEGMIKETVTKFPTGEISEEQRKKILMSVPIYAAMESATRGQEKAEYTFRVASDEPRNKNNRATPEEKAMLEKFRDDPNLKDIAQKTDDGKFLQVVAPVRLVRDRGCMTCHGDPATSPWGNGKDILGFKMENVKEGDVHAIFVVTSKLEPSEKRAESAMMNVAFFGVIATILALGLGYLMIRISVKSLVGIADRVSESSELVSRASDSLASASQQLASSSQEQSSSVEEVSSSLEEISGMVSSALKGSRDAVELSNRVSSLVSSGTEAMTELQASVNQIAESNARVERLAKLIEEIGEKTELIDEIVFQTRLLSFNASVEAERAGEHGRGFAVVAQEVGNLAQMSGKSAMEISQIVKNSIKEAQEVTQSNRVKVEQGVVLCQKASQQLNSINQASQEILSGAEQVLRASEEQNAGIQQINQSIQLISQATQENASSAENCSANSQSLTDQSDTMNLVVKDLEALIYGKSLEGKETAEKAESKPVSSYKSQEAEFEKKGKVMSFVKPNRTQPLKKAAGSDVTEDSDPWEKI